MLLKGVKIPEHRNLKPDRKFAVAPMMESENSWRKAFSF